MLDPEANVVTVRDIPVVDVPDEANRQLAARHSRLAILQRNDPGLLFRELVNCDLSVSVVAWGLLITHTQKDGDVGLHCACAGADEEHADDEARKTADAVDALRKGCTSDDCQTDHVDPNTVRLCLQGLEHKKGDYMNPT